MAQPAAVRFSKVPPAHLEPPAPGAVKVSKGPKSNVPVVRPPQRAPSTNTDGSDSGRPPRAKGSRKSSVPTRRNSPGRDWESDGSRDSDSRHKSRENERERERGGESRRRPLLSSSYSTTDTDSYRPSSYPQRRSMRHSRSSSQDNSRRHRPPMCPRDLSCPDINDPMHQSEWRHTCRRVKCEYLWMEEHRRLFTHVDNHLLLVPEPDRDPVGSCPTCGSASVQESHRHWSGRHSASYPNHEPIQPQPVRPPPRIEAPEQQGVFTPRQPLPSTPGYEGLRRAPPLPPHTSSVQQSQQEEELAALRQKTRDLEARLADSEHREPQRTAPTLQELDTQLKGRLDGFALLKELENLCMEVRTLRHLYHFRHALAEQHTAGTVAFQIDHSSRRVEATVRRVKRLQEQLDEGDVLQGRADDEVFFAKELLAMVEGGDINRLSPDPGSSRRICPVPDPYDDTAPPRLVHMSISAPPTSRRLDTLLVP